MLRRAAVSIAALSALTVALVATSESPLGINLSGATVALDDHGLFELADDSDDTDDPVLVAAAWRVDLGTTVGTTRMAPYNWLRARLDGGPEVGLPLLVDDCDGNVLADTPELVPSPDVLSRSPNAWTHELNLPFITWDCDDAGQCETSICVTAAETTRAVADLDLELQIAFQVTEGESASEVTTTVERLPDPEPE